MLVLSRKLGETIVIGTDIKVTVVGIERGRIRLAFQCPKSVPVYRSEFLEKDNAKGTDATKAGSPGPVVPPLVSDLPAGSAAKGEPNP